MGRWTDLASNRWIAKADVQDGIGTGVLILIGSAPGIGDEQFISRAQLEAWISCTGTGASNQFQVKSGSVFPPPNSHTIYWPGEINIWTSAAIACANTGTAYTVYSTCGTLNDGCRIWSQFGFWTSTSTEWYKTNDGRTFQLDGSGYIYNMQSCTTSTAHTVRLDYSTAFICSAGTTTVYTSGGWGVGTYVYSDSGLTTLVTGYNNIERVSDGIIYDINSTTGQIQSDTGLAC